MSIQAPPFVTIRAADASDDARLAEIDAATWSPSVHPGLRPAGDVFFRPGVEPSDTLVAVADGKVVGFVLLGAPTSLPASDHVQMVRGIGAAPEAQRGGIGRALVEAAVDAASERGTSNLSLRVLGTNDGARRLYERCGFAEEGVIRGEVNLDGRDVDDRPLAMRLSR